jgi:SAM-dependent MidA family methyltransferase
VRADRSGRDAPAAASRPPSPGLLARLREVAGPGGFIPFDRFMEIALYAEGIGYYGRETGPFGTSGDYYTAPAVHPLFAETVAARAQEVLARLPADRPARLVELGPGDGTLSARVASAIGRSNPSRSDVEYVLVERSPPLRRRALEAVLAAAVGSSVKVRALPSLSADGPFSGVVLANELLDAQPARRLLFDDGAWSEIGVKVEGELLVEAISVARPVPGAPLPASPQPGTVYEFSPVAEGIVREIGDHLVDGLAILIDYGMDEGELLAAHPRGTLQSIRRHRAADDPLVAPGESDLSVFVNRSRIRAVARAAGLREVACRSQAEALGAWGFPRLLQSAVRASRSAGMEVRTRLAAKNLLFGFERFWALELSPAGSSTSLGEARSS